MAQLTFSAHTAITVEHLREYIILSDFKNCFWLKNKDSYKNKIYAFKMIFFVFYVVIICNKTT